MHRRAAILTAAVGLSLLSARRAGADELAPKDRAAVDKGLAWLVRNQHRDGHWEANGGQHPVPMTALAGMALLLDGNTPREGRYAANVRRATDWLVSRSQPNGLLVNPNAPRESNLYMFGHGFSLWYLAQVFGEADGIDQRKQLADVLTRAVKFSAQAQTTRGGWGYVAARDGNNFDEGAVTFVQIHALFAARNAGIPVEKKLLEASVGYLKASQTAQGGMIYSIATGGGGDRPTISAEALAVALGTDLVDKETTRKLLVFVRNAFPLGQPLRQNVNDGFYAHFYLAQAARLLGDEGYGKRVPGAKPDEQLTWGRYRTAVFEQLRALQKADGSWEESSLGPVFATACCLTILQQDLQPTLGPR